MSKKKKETFSPGRRRIGGFSENDGTLDFYLRINSLINEESVVLDLGAGRASWFEDDRCSTRRNVRRLQGKVKHLIAADIDDAVLDNRSSDSQIIIKNGVLGLERESVDLIVADFVLEHVDNPTAFFQQVDSCLKPGGWFCARTPHKYSYVAMVASLVKNSSHSRVLTRVQPERQEKDIFPTHYKLNRLRDIHNTFLTWESASFIYRPEPAYYFGNKMVFELQAFIHRLMPAFMSGNLFVFVKKRQG